MSQPQPMKIWIDGAIVDAGEARISVLDHGLLYGDGLFEGIRISGGKVFRLGDHLRRFSTGARAIGLVLPHAIDAIEKMTQGVVSVNPNTMYPLLRDLESRKMIEGDWEHPDKRTRRFYSITEAGEQEYERLLDEIEPFLDSVIESVTLIRREVYGA